MIRKSARVLFSMVLASLGGVVPAAPAPQTPQGVEGLVAGNSKLIEARYASAAEIGARSEWERERGIDFPKLVRGNPKRKEIALTFDDGPHALFTPRLLDLLRQLDVKATFFLVGKMVDRYPDLVRREVAEGHEVANHTYDHLRLASVPPQLIEPELREGARAIERAVGSPTRLYRPPGGEYDADVIDATKRLGYVMVLWTDDPGDFRRPSSGIIEDRILKGISNGAILLLHDGIPQTMDILPNLVARLRQKGYSFVTVSEMAAQAGVIKTGGPRVRAPGSPPDHAVADQRASRPSPSVLRNMRALALPTTTAKRRGSSE